MLLSELVEYLTYGELSNLYVSGTEEKGIRHKDLPKIISNINLGMIDLHKRFPVLYKQVNIQMHEHISDYVLDSYYAETNTESGAAYKYIKDSVNNPFSNDVIRIINVVNEDDCKYPLNTQNNPYSLFTPSYNIVQVPYPLDENIIAVEYQAYPAKIPTNTTDTENFYIEFPEVMLEALIAFVNYKIYTGTGNDKPEAIGYYQKYEAECLRLASLGIFNSDIYENLRLESNQWV